MINKKHTPLLVILTLLVTVLGIIVGFSLPNALLPKIKRPEIQLITSWPGKGAQQIEQSLIAPLERQLQGLDNLIATQSQINEGFASTRLEFHSDADMQQRYIDVLSRVNQVPGWPPQVARPRVINNATGTSTLATAMVYSRVAKTEQQLIAAFEHHIAPAMAGIQGVAALITPTTPTDLRVDIEFDPLILARYSLTIAQIREVLSSLADRSGDNLVLGSREYALHFNGKIALKELQNVAISVQNQHIIRLGELASIHTRVAEQWNFASIMGNRALYMIFQPTPDINALKTIGLIKAQIAALNAGALAELDMTLTLSRDDSKAVKQSLILVYGNILLGILLACAVLYYFLRNWQLVSLIFVSIPVCLSMVMLAMKFFGYSLNVISLAGLALSVGLLLDAAIVVVENILRKRQEGSDLAIAIDQGSKEVTGAIVSSTLSSIIIFVPILMMNSSESQLFADLAFTISSALMASVAVALVLIPALARYLLAKPAKSVAVSQPGQGPGQGLDLDLDLDLDNQAAGGLSKSQQWNIKLALPAKHRTLAIWVLVLAIPLALLVTYVAVPSIDVLPNPKQKAVRSFINFNEPLSAKAAEKNIAQTVFARIKDQDALGLAPAYDVYGMFCQTDNCLLYFYPGKGWDYQEFSAWLNKSILHDLAGVEIFTVQGSLLRFAMPNARQTQLDIKGDSLDNLQQTGRALLGLLKDKFPKANIGEGSPLYNQSSRIEFTPNQDNLVHLGMSAAQLNQQLVALTDGVYLGRFWAQGNTLPFYLKGKPVTDIETLMKTQIMVPGHGLVALAQLVDIKMSVAPASLLRINRESSVSLNISPPGNMPVGPFMAEVKQIVTQYINNSDSKHLYISYRGSSDRLNAFLQEFGQMLLVSLLVLTLLMWLTLKSWSLAIGVILSMPLAMAGGMLSLQLLNLFTPQNLDVVTMIGFIILMGLVINNAILLASQFDLALQRGLTQYDAIIQAIALRKRAIYMSTGTSIFGMLPLMLSPGEGAEIYRGLAAVIIGGMTMSALFSMSFMAALLSLGLFAKKTGKAAGMAQAA